MPIYNVIIQGVSRTDDGKNLVSYQVDREGDNQTAILTDVECSDEASLQAALLKALHPRMFIGSAFQIEDI